MKLKLFGFAVFIFLLSSCDNKTTLKFEISNNSNAGIDSLRIIPSGYESDYFISIATNMTEEYVMDLTNIAKIDGDYQIDFINDSNVRISKTFGYYTNGFPIEKLIRVKINNDTIIFDSELGDY